MSIIFVNARCLSKYDYTGIDYLDMEGDCIMENPNLDLQKLNREVAKWVGLEYCYSCKVYFLGKYCKGREVNFIHDPALLLRLMIKREDWRELRIALNDNSYAAAMTYNDYIPTRYVVDNETGLLLIKVAEWKDKTTP